MTTSDLLARLKEQDVKIHAAGDALRVDAPKGALTPELVEALRENKGQLLELLSESGAETIPAREPGRCEFPLSFAQHAFFMLAQIDPSNGAYNLHSARRVTGAIDLAALNTSLRDVIARHEILRTRFELRDGAPVQVVEREIPAQVTVADLSGAAEGEKQLGIARLLSRERHEDLNVRSTPLFRVDLLKLGATEYVFLLRMHHIIGDAVGLDLFCADLLEAYRSRLAGREPQWTPNEIQYGDYSAWQRERLAGEALENHLGFWRAELAEVPRLLDSMATGASSSNRATTLKSTLPSEFAASVREFAESHGVTPFTVTLSAFQYLLGRYARWADVPVIVPFSSRAGRETERMIGLFVNGVVIRMRLAPQVTGETLVASVRKKTAEVLEHRDLSLELLEGLFRARGRPEPALAKMSRIGFNYLVSPGRGPAQVGDLTVEPLEVERTHTVFELMLTVLEAPGEFSLRLEYRAGFFERGLMEQFTADLIRLLRAMIEAPDVALGELCFETPRSILNRLRLEDNNYETAFPLTPRAAGLARWSGPGKRHRVLGYAIELSPELSKEQIEKCHRLLIEEMPGLRSHVVRSPETWLDEYYQCVGRPAVAALAEIEGDWEAVAAAESGRMQEIDTERPSRAILVSSARGLVYVFLANEIALGTEEVEAHRRAFLSRVQPEAPGAMNPAPQAELAGEDLAEISSWCAAHGLSREDFFERVFALLVGVYTQAPEPFSFWRQAGSTLARRAFHMDAKLAPAQALLSCIGPGSPDAISPDDRVRFVFETQAGSEPLVMFADGCVYFSTWITESSVKLSLACDAGFSKDRFLRRFMSVARQIARGLHDWRESALLLDEEAEEIAQLNRTHRDYPEAETALDLFTASLARAEGRTAVMCGNRKLTYGEIDALSSSIARTIQGNTGEGPVGVCLERSEWLPVALLGVLKSGRPYLPLDPEFPPDRLQYALRKTSAGLILADAVTYSLFREEKILRIEDALAEPACTTNLPRVAGETLAYVIFTSGSTGRPKGVCISHASLANFLRAMAEAPGIRQDDVLAAITTPAFDISLLELLFPLTLGARIVIADAQSARDGARLGNLLAECGVTMLQATPSGWAMLIESGWKGCESLTALCGGEALPEALAAKLRPLVKRLWNLYGPTETTIWSTVSRVEPDAPLTIGRPIANTEIYVVDSLGRHLPPGVAGELWIAGKGLSSGYFGEPELTRERFVTLRTPEGRTPAAYRTGDIVRLRGDGTLQFLRRNDRQVKLRGSRIELGEVESCLLSCEGVNRATAMIREEADGAVLAAYFTASRDRIHDEVRAHLTAKLPAYMIPQWLIQLGGMPFTPNGKVDLRALPRPEQARAEPRVAPGSELEKLLSAIWAEALGHENFDAHDNFFEIGGHSLLLLRVHRRVAAEIEPAITPTDLFTYATITELAGYIESRRAPAVVRRSTRETAPAMCRDIAVIGMAGQFPGAGNVREFWENIRGGGESIRLLSPKELDAEGVPRELLANPRYVPAAGLLPEIELFDAEFFKISNRIARLTDPQHRVLLECAYEALEDAGYNPFAVPGTVGVFAGVGFNSYLMNNLLPNQAVLNVSSPLELLYANDRDYASTLISYRLNLTGPSINVATACSTSLVAVHLACRSLVDGECDFALAGGSKIAVPQRTGYIHVEGGLFSSDGHCRAFDDDASGTVFGSGAGVVVLKRLEDARRDRDAIYAVIKGSAINNDGASKVGYTAPSARGQRLVISEALRVAGVNPETVQYVEMHGTGTRLGDPVEVAALTEAFRESTQQSGFCAIGSVKSNIGHLDPAAGIAGFLKTVLAIYRQEIPPAAQFRKANSQIPFEATPFYVNRTLSDWRPGILRRAGVSSFGIGGTNAHAVLEEAPRNDEADSTRPELLVLSGRSEQAVLALRDRVADHLQMHPSESVSDVAYTLQTGRPMFHHRISVAAMNAGDAAARLKTARPCASDHKPVAFLFPGQGSQFSGMAQAIYRREPVFREHFDACAELVRDRARWDLKEIVFAREGASATRLAQTRHTQAALFAVEWSLARLLMSLGIQPKAMLGHSVGEYAAACVSGAVNFDAALGLILERSEWMQRAPSGTMAAIASSAAEVGAGMEPGCEIAAINSEQITVIAGDEQSVRRMMADWRRRGVPVQMLDAERAFHSRLMDEALDPIEAYARRNVSASEPQIPYVSNLTGGWVDRALLDGGTYWARHARNPVRFSEGLRLLLEDDSIVLLEVGPGRTLSGLARRTARAQHRAVLSCLPGAATPEVEEQGLLDAVGALWERGHAIDWENMHRGRRPSHVHLPTYPFERVRHWVDRSGQRFAAPLVGPLRRDDIAEWFYEPSWKRRRLPPSGEASASGTTVLLAHREDRVAEEANRQLASHGLAPILVFPGPAFRKLPSGRSFELNVRDPDDFHRLISAIETPAISNVVHLWSMRRFESIADALDFNFYSMLHLAQAQGGANLPKRILIATLDAQNVHANEDLRPEGALVLGPALTFPREYPGWRCAVADFEGNTTGDGAALTAALIVDEVRRGMSESVVAYRGTGRWVRSFEPVSLPSNEGGARGSVYWITGGASGIGFALAGALARGGVQLILSGRHSIDDRLARIKALEEYGAKVHYVAADVSDAPAMKRAFEDCGRRFGQIDCVLHAAGVADSGLAHFRRRPQMESVFAPKIEGALVLKRLCAEQNVPSLVFFSSITAITGDAGQVAYCSANAFLDSLAEAERRKGRGVYSVNWDTWSETGMARETRVPEAVKAIRDARLALGIRNHEGAAVLDRVLAAPALQVVVSTIPLEDRLRFAAAMDTPRAAPAMPRDRPPSLENTPEEPANEIETRLIELWQESFGLTRVGATDDFFELGGTSLQAIDLVARIEKIFGQRLDPNTLLRHPTVRAVAKMIGQSSQPPHLLITTLRAGASQAPAWFLVHPVGGQLYQYRSVAQSLAPERAVYGIRAPAPEALERFENVEALAAEYVTAIRAIQSFGPYLLAGSSFGGTLAFEMARQMRAARIEVGLLAMLDTPGGSQVRHEFIDDVDILAYFASELPPETGLTAAALRAQAPGDVLEYFRSRLRRIGTGLRELDGGALRATLETFRHNMRLMKAYSPQWYGGEVHFFRARERRAEYDPPDPESAWRGVCPHLVVYEAPGNHFTMHGEPNVAAIAAQLNRLAGADRVEGAPATRGG